MSLLARTAHYTYCPYRPKRKHKKENVMPKTTSEQNKTIVLEAFETLFNKRDYEAAERYWSPNYIQHSAHIEPGREGLFNLTKGIPSTSVSCIFNLGFLGSPENHAQASAGKG